jgi:hypothetical protein
MPEDLFDQAADQANDFGGGTFTLASENSKQSFELRRNRTSLGDPEAGYSLSFSDITSYIETISQ